MGPSSRAAALLSLALLLSPPAASGSGHPDNQGRPLVFRTLPLYPELARRMHVWGEVIVHAQVLPDGTVKETHAITGHRLLRQAAEDAVRQWRFAPESYPSVAVVSVQFHDGNE